MPKNKKSRYTYKRTVNRRKKSARNKSINKKRSRKRSSYKSPKRPTYRSPKRSAYRSLKRPTYRSPKRPAYRSPKRAFYFDTPTTSTRIIPPAKITSIPTTSTRMIPQPLPNLNNVFSSIFLKPIDQFKNDLNHTEQNDFDDSRDSQKEELIKSLNKKLRLNNERITDIKLGLPPKTIFNKQIDENVYKKIDCFEYCKQPCLDKFKFESPECSQKRYDLYKFFMDNSKQKTLDYNEFTEINSQSICKLKEVMNMYTDNSDIFQGIIKYCKMNTAFFNNRFVYTNEYKKEIQDPSFSRVNSLFKILNSIFIYGPRLCNDIYTYRFVNSSKSSLNFMSKLFSTPSFTSNRLISTTFLPILNKTFLHGYNHLENIENEDVIEFNGKTMSFQEYKNNLRESLNENVKNMSIVDKLLETHNFIFLYKVPKYHPALYIDQEVEILLPFNTVLNVKNIHFEKITNHTTSFKESIKDILSEPVNMCYIYVECEPYTTIQLKELEAYSDNNVLKAFLSD